MSIRVGRRIYDGSTFKDPSFEDYKKIICMTPSTPYGSLSPYSLKNEEGFIMENIWQFSKIFEKVPYTKHFYSRYDKTVIWEYPEEVHYVDGNITEDYKKWRNAGISNKHVIRYPVPFNYRSKCIGSIKNIEEPILLDYISARKQIYLPLYVDMVSKDKDKYIKLKNMLLKGENL